MPAPVFYVPNHSADSLCRVDDIAELPKLFPPRHADFKTKDEFAKWSHDIGTKHCFYALTQPSQPGLRASRLNPPQYLHGLIADYDGDAAVIQAALGKLQFPSGRAPAWITTTYSGKARLIWLFAAPVPVFNQEVSEKFLSILKKELKLTSLLPGLDEAAFKNLLQIYELGRDWRQPFGDTRLPSEMVMTALFEASHKAAKSFGDAEVPLDVISVEAEKRFPSRWSGPFVDGARGVRFWDPKADNKSGCVVRAAGMQAFTGEGRLVPWAEIFGEDFVKQYRENRIGSAIGGIYHDGQYFWRRDGKGRWRAHNVDAIKRILFVECGLAKEGKRGVPPEVDQAIVAIMMNRSIDGVFPFLFDRRELIQAGEQEYLNVSRVTPLRGPGIDRAWGDGFPWIAKYLEGLFGAEQLQVFLSWLSHFYQNGLAGTPCLGHGLFIAGPASAGKTLLSHRVIGAIMGGFGDATQFILGQTIFNEDLGFQPVWCVDDSEATTSQQKHALFSQTVKRVVANPEQQFNAKFKKAVTQRWCGRLVVTLNDDPESVRMLPQVDHSNLDKLVILRASASSVSFADAEENIRTELPAFADFLRTYEIPAWLKKNDRETARFGHDAWHHPELLEFARENSPSAGVREILERWRTLYFRGNNDGEWTGTATELLGELLSTEGVAPLVRSVAANYQQLSAGLRTLFNSQVPWLKPARLGENRQQGWVIQRPDNMAFRRAA